jgi:hypothetical protein
MRLHHAAAFLQRLNQERAAGTGDSVGDKRKDRRGAA